MLTNPRRKKTHFVMKCSHRKPRTWTETLVQLKPKRNEVTGEWRKLNIEGLNDLYSSSNMVRMIKSSRLRWTGHVERMGRGEAFTGSWRGNLRERDHLGVPAVDGG